MVTLKRKAVEDTGWPLANQSDMLKALTKLIAQGFTGAVSYEDDAWSLRLSANGRNTVTAQIGQWLVLDGNDLRAVKQPELLVVYDVDEKDKLPEPAPEPEPEPEIPTHEINDPGERDNAVAVARPAGVTRG